MGRLGHVAALDGLRGVAILLVVSVHFTGVPKGGGLGVDLFFVLSGFLITTLLLEERERDGRIRIRAFYERRARRLLPALAVLLLAFLVIDAAQGRNGLSQVAVYGLYAGNAYEAFVSSVSTPSLGLVHLWSLAQEEQFYLLWPLGFLLAVRSRRPARWLAALFALLVCYRIALVAHGAPMYRIDRGPDTQSEPLVAGCLIAFVRHRGRRWRPPPYLTVVAMATFGARAGGAPGALVRIAGHRDRFTPFGRLQGICTTLGTNPSSSSVASAAASRISGRPRAAAGTAIRAVPAAAMPAGPGSGPTSRSAARPTFSPPGAMPPASLRGKGRGRRPGPSGRIRTGVRFGSVRSVAGGEGEIRE